MNRRFAVVGCGSIGLRHLRNLASLGCTDLVAVDPSPARLELAAAETGAQTAPTLTAALAAGASVVLVTSPTTLHVEAAFEALEAGADLFVEKPLAAALEGLDELIETAERTGSIALVACNLRFHPGLRRLHQLAGAGAIGRVLSARLDFGSRLPGRRPSQDYRTGYAARRESGGGVVLDAIHELDIARWLLGDVESVACFADRLGSLELETEDVAAILLRFAGGAIGEIHLDYVQREYSRSCRLVGEEGTLHWDFSSGVVLVHAGDAFEAHRHVAGGGAERISLPTPSGWNVNDMYVAELEHFLACLRGDDSPEQTLRDGKRALEIALAALESAADGTVVRLGEPPI